jgi:hypothetical protein
MLLQHQQSWSSTQKRHTAWSLHQYIRCFGINRNLAGTWPSKHCGIPKCPLYWKNGWIWWWISGMCNKKLSLREYSHGPYSDYWCCSSYIDETKQNIQLVVLLLYCPPKTVVLEVQTVINCFLLDSIFHYRRGLQRRSQKIHQHNIRHSA